MKIVSHFVREILNFSLIFMMDEAFTLIMSLRKSIKSYELFASRHQIPFVQF
jgi:hypothetical protein